ncbi:fatty acyl-AMP ligase [Streptomyces sp. NPDC059688]|uniref:Fatty acyl-AMP ligase n=2 Tax=Streptomyces TaxID=1883 RepID=A0ABV1U3B5_9ACTN|nr:MULTISPECIES: fatty acyl-AMP ligase [unclassified Streptomyces]OKJ79751.1 polyketide synthase [Streptomyces sp. CB01883]ROP46506.1 acyl-CoA synthetase (AMP-forming)/AMP-acid ligase II [Streptomyces sp. PanSC9]UXY38612.1 fatty acyl-AMP ligase [Streptomyces sp. HUAS 14-6]
MTSFRTFTELVLDRAAELGTEDAFIFLPDDANGSAPEHLSYSGLDREARRIASWLQENGAAGRQVLLLYPSGNDFIKAFTGCLYAGSVAVPAPLPTEQGQHFTRVSGILRDAEVRAVLTDSASAPEISAWLAAEGMTDVLCLATDTGEYGDPGAYTVPDLGPEHLAFLQYTSGSTSDPKGVMVSHRNLLANEAAIQRAAGTSARSRFGGWLPFYHDMGLIGHVLHPLYVGGSAVLMSPVSFLRRPQRWLKVFGEHGANIGGGPNFAYDLCTRRITDEQLAELDLSGWECAGNGAEPVRAETIKAFSERFAPAGFRPEAFFPCYGMAETTLLVSGTPKDRQPAVRTVDSASLEQGTLDGPRDGGSVRHLVSSGVVQDFTVRVVDPDSRRERPEGTVGEIWVKGDSVADGYWKRPLTNVEIFDAHITDGKGGEDAGGWLRTGDLGALEDGELYVTGRLKELIIFAGRNLYPQDVERAVQSTDKALGIGSGAVFTVETDREHLIVVQEVRVSAVSGDLRGLATGVQRLLGQDLQIPAGNVVLVRPGTIRKTTSGKIQRTLMRKLFLEGALTPLYEVLEPAVRRIVADATGSSLAPAV